MYFTQRGGAFVAIVLGAMIAAAICIAITTVERLAYGCDEVCSVAAAIRRLQPAASEERALALAAVFVEAGEESVVDPLLLVAIAMRESSLHPAVEDLTRRGSRGEVGLLQLHGAALRLRPEECSAELEGARCQVRAGARWLAYVRERCEGSTWVWVAGYGRRRCPSESEARVDRNANVAASYYSQAGGREWR